ncbi:MAG TPA: hypothetical protein VGP72_31175 [Planctomycetota bacterium]|jgi:hypothetical protein
MPLTYIPVDSRLVPYTGDADASKFVTIEKGTRFGPFEVELVEDNALALKALPHRTFKTLAGGIGLTLAAALLWYGFLNTNSDSRLTIAAIACTVGGPMLIWRALLRVGLVYVVDGTTRSLVCESKFAQRRIWSHNDLSPVVLAIGPQTRAARESLNVQIRDRKNAIIQALFEERVDNNAALPAMNAGATIARLLGLQLLVYGEVTVMGGTEDLRKVLCSAMRNPVEAK